MGCGKSRYYHDDEKGWDDKQLVEYELEPQPLDVLHDLDTDNDQKGRVSVDCIFRPTREIYGQRAADLSCQPINWAEFGILFKKRPFPHDFPAFAHEKTAALAAEKEAEEGKNKANDLLPNYKNIDEEKGGKNRNKTERREEVPKSKRITDVMDEDLLSKGN